MGSKTFNGVRFAAYTKDHWPPHVHGFYAVCVVVIDLYLSERAVRISSRRRAVRPLGAKQADVHHIRDTAAKYFDEIVALWEQAQ